MPTMEKDNDGHWTDPDPNKCLECKRARECSTKFFYLDQKYPENGDHCECGHITNAFRDSPEADEALTAQRIPHTNLCTDHMWRVWEAMVALKKSYRPHE